MDKHCLTQQSRGGWWTTVALSPRDEDIKMDFLAFVENYYPGANPTFVRYTATGVIIYNATNALKPTLAL
jgi:hypothetical protein